MIEILNYNGDYLVFDVDDWATLRKTHRILGTLVGSTNSIQTLPLKLLPEEVLLLVDKGLAKVVEHNFEVTQEDIKRHEDFENELFQQETILYRSIRKRQLETMINDIVAAKRKRGDGRSSEDIFAEELEKSSQINKQNMIWPIPLKSSSASTTDVSREELLKSTSSLKYHIYKDLWEKGYYITSGFKFGADFLVYLGDPVGYHAIFIVHCIEDPNHSIHSTEIVAFGRLASAVKKRAVLASMKDSKVSYVTMNWIDA